MGTHTHPLVTHLCCVQDQHLGTDKSKLLIHHIRSFTKSFQKLRVVHKEGYVLLNSAVELLTNICLMTPAACNSSTLAYCVYSPFSQSLNCVYSPFSQTLNCVYSPFSQSLNCVYSPFSQSLNCVYSPFSQSLNCVYSPFSQSLNCVYSPFSQTLNCVYSPFLKTLNCVYSPFLQTLSSQSCLKI